jgi:chemotaxis protein methyltransferase WspC
MRADLVVGVEELLTERIGLDRESLPRDAVAAAIRSRQRALVMTDTVAYCARIRSDPSELDAMIEAIVVPETWFFRDWQPFELIKRLAGSEWRTLTARRPLRVLSLPCSTGEEAYSAVIVLVAGGLEPDRLAVDACDVSAHAITIAEQGRYGRTAFRDARWSAYRQYFVEHGSYRTVVEPVRASVHFATANALELRGALENDQYDLVLCRNLLIYLCPNAQQRLVAILDKLLLPCGILVLGHAETPQVFVPSYPLAAHAGAFAVRKPVADEPRSKRIALRPSSARGLRGQPAHQHDAFERERSSRPRRRVAAQALDLDELLARARSFADRGELVEARQLAQKVLHADAALAAAHYLLGVIAHAEGDDSHAEACFERTLYLQPDHNDALVHLILLLEGSGRRAHASVLRERVRRAAAAGR